MFDLLFDIKLINYVKEWHDQVLCDIITQDTTIQTSNAAIFRPNNYNLYSFIIKSDNFILTTEPSPGGGDYPVSTFLT